MDTSMEEDYAHDTCSMFTNGLYKYGPVIMMFEGHRHDVLKEALKRLLKMPEYQDTTEECEQWLVDCRKERLIEAMMADDLNPNQ